MPIIAVKTYMLLGVHTSNHPCAKVLATHAWDSKALLRSHLRHLTRVSQYQESDVHYELTPA